MQQYSKLKFCLYTSAFIISFLLAISFLFFINPSYTSFDLMNVILFPGYWLVYQNGSYRLVNTVQMGFWCVLFAGLFFWLSRIRSLSIEYYPRFVPAPQEQHRIFGPISFSIEFTVLFALFRQTRYAKVQDVIVLYFGFSQIVYVLLFCVMLSSIMRNIRIFHVSCLYKSPDWKGIFLSLIICLVLCILAVNWILFVWDKLDFPFSSLPHSSSMFLTFMILQALFWTFVVYCALRMFSAAPFVTAVLGFWSQHKNRIWVKSLVYAAFVTGFLLAISGALLVWSDIKYLHRSFEWERSPLQWESYELQMPALKIAGNSMNQNQTSFALCNVQIFIYQFAAWFIVGLLLFYFENIMCRIIRSYRNRDRSQQI